MSSGKFYSFSDEEESVDWLERDKVTQIQGNLIKAKEPIDESGAVKIKLDDVEGQD